MFALARTQLAVWIFLNLVLIGFVEDRAKSAEWKTKRIESLFFAEGASAGDLNGDGHLDVVVGPLWYAGPDFESVREIAPAKSFPVSAYSDQFFSHVADVDRDGANDVLVVGFPGMPARLYLNPGKDKLDQHWEKLEITGSVDNESPHFVDIVPGGLPEIVCGNGTRYGYFHAGDDGTQKWVFHAISRPGACGGKFTHGLGVGDVNSDGRLDILDQKFWWEQPDALDGQTWKKRAWRTAGEGGAHICVADLDDDGDNDLVTSLAAHAWGLSWFENQGNEEFVERKIMGARPEDSPHGIAFSQMHAVALADIDADGRLDVVTGKRWMAHGGHDPGASEPPVLYWFRNVEKKAEPAQSPARSVIDFVPRMIDDDSGVGVDLLVVDLNQDDRLDVVSASKKGLSIHVQSSGQVREPVQQRNGHSKDLASEVPRKTQAETPNIVLLVADDLGYGELGCQGNPQIPTPHIDRLAAEGVRFTQAYVTAPNCSPSRAGLLTGRIPTRFGYEFNPIGARNEEPGVGLPAAENTLAEALHARGYTTGLIGKWHLGGQASFHPLRHGFDEFFGFTHEGHYFVPPPYKGVMTMLRRRSLPGGELGRWVGKDLIYSTHMGHDEPAYDANNPIVRGGQPVNESDYLTDAFSREACGFIKRHHDKPFFLMLAYNAVHSPLQARHEDLEELQDIEDPHRRIFAGMLSALDRGVGQVLHQLDDSNCSDRTLVIFLSDNGGPTKELTSSNLPLRGQKGHMYEGGIRIPMLARWPGEFPRGEQCERVVSSLDIFPTALTAAGGRVAADVDGVDLRRTMAGTVSSRTLFWRQGKRAALRFGDWKLVQNGNRNERWELFDLATDLSEANDLSRERPELFSRLKRRWEETNSKMSVSIF